MSDSKVPAPTPATTIYSPIYTPTPRIVMGVMEGTNRVRGECDTYPGLEEWPTERSVLIWVTVGLPAGATILSGQVPTVATDDGAFGASAVLYSVTPGLLATVQVHIPWPVVAPPTVWPTPLKLTIKIPATPGVGPAAKEQEDSEGCN